MLIVTGSLVERLSNSEWLCMYIHSTRRHWQGMNATPHAVLVQREFNQSEIRAFKPRDISTAVPSTAAEDGRSSARRA